MPATGPSAGSTATRDAAARGRSWTWPWLVPYAALVVVFALYGALWIALHAGGGRGSTHTLFQSLALAEATLALLMRRRKPVGALAGILAVYALFSLDSLLLPAVLFALLTVATERDKRTAAVAIAVWPDIGRHAVSFVGYSLPRLAAAGAAVAAGMYLRERRNRRSRAGS